LVLGILFQIEFSFPLPYLIPLFCASAALFIVVLLVLQHDLKHKLRHFIGLFSFTMLFMLGIVIVGLHEIKNRTDHISKLSYAVDAYQAVISSEPEEKERSVKAEMQIVKVKVNQHWQNASGQVMTYFAKDTLRRKFKYGDILVVKAGIPLVESPKNPFEFNLKRFYGFKGITHRQFLKAENYIHIGNQPPNRFISFAIGIRKKVDAIFTKYIATERERNIASALILGIKNELDDEIQYAYSATGTMHVLAVSGLHVGIIYGLLVLLTSVLLKLKHGNFIQSALLFVLIWLYALVTGLCPSVLRAVTMLSLVIVSKLFGFRSNVFNTLFATVFFLLCTNPFMVMEVGFQLSFLAVFGIVYLYEKIYHLFEIENRVLDWAWSITVMSISAQLATFPLGMLYFHQFPNLFLMSNLVVIPFAILIMYVGFGFMVLSWLPFVANWLGVLVEKMVWLLNQIILGIEKIPHSLWLGIHISVFETWLIYTAIVAMVLLLNQKSFIYALSSFMLVLFFCIIQIFKIQGWQNQNRMIVYNVSKSYGLDIICGRNAMFICDSALPNDRQKMQFHILNHRWASGIRSVSASSNAVDAPFGKLFHANDLLVAQVTKPFYASSAKRIKIDYLIVSNNAVKYLKYLRNTFIFNKIIIDNSNKTYLANQLIEQARVLGIQVHYTAKEGAFVKDI